MVVSGQKGWEKQTLLKQSFENYMEKTPFKSSSKFHASEQT